MVNKIDRFLNESYYGQIKIASGAKVDYFKNIQNVKMLNRYARGFILPNGDFYIFDSKDEFLSHFDGLAGAKKLGIIKKYDTAWYVKGTADFVCVQRENETGEFYLSESYSVKVIEQTHSIIKSIMDAAQEKAYTYNPALLFFASQ